MNIPGTDWSTGTPQLPFQLHNSLPFASAVCTFLWPLHCHLLANLSLRGLVSLIPASDCNCIFLLLSSCIIILSIFYPVYFQFNFYFCILIVSLFICHPYFIFRFACIVYLSFVVIVICFTCFYFNKLRCMVGIFYYFPIHILFILCLLSEHR